MARVKALSRLSNHYQCQEIICYNWTDSATPTELTLQTVHSPGGSGPVETTTAGPDIVIWRKDNDDDYMR